MGKYCQLEHTTLPTFIVGQDAQQFPTKNNGTFSGKTNCKLQDGSVGSYLLLLVLLLFTDF